jgi:hypothetical protein
MKGNDVDDQPTLVVKLLYARGVCPIAIINCSGELFRVFSCKHDKYAIFCERN